MTFTDGRPGLYEALDLSPDATAPEIRAAYLRAKTAYQKNSVALYTLIDEAETDALLNRIEEAYRVLSNPELRREYDRSYGALDIGDGDDSPARVPHATAAPAAGEVVSIDRVPPMEGGGDELLVAPATDFTAPAAGSNRSAAGVFGTTEAPLPSFQGPRQQEARAADPFEGFSAPKPAAPNYAPPPARTAPEIPVQSAPAHKTLLNVPSSHSVDEITKDITIETEWRGPFLRKVRESRHVSLEELSDFTKITKSYIAAIEEENFAKLPATVFLRGFLTQIAKALKLPHEKVVTAYLDRYKQARPEKARG
jgi:curved DNA-binding protein CbpA